jgi:hypothetical protein
VANGYVVNSEHQQPLPAEPSQREKLMEGLKVGIHLGCQVTFGDRTYEGMEVVTTGHRVHQVFCAAMNTGQGQSGLRNASLPGAREKAEILLRAAYRGTYLAAIANGCRMLYLTMIGGGVFGNDFTAIFNEIFSAHVDLARNPAINKTLQTVRLILYSPPPGRDEFIAKLEGARVPFRSIVYRDS